MTNTSRILDPKLVKPYITWKNWRIGAIKGSFRDKLCQELTLESLQNRRWFRKLCIFHRIVKEKSWKYLFDLAPPSSNLPKTKISQNFGALDFKVRNNFFLDSFSPLILSEWKKTRVDINSPSYSLKTSSNSVFILSNPKGLIFWLTSLVLDISENVILNIDRTRMLTLTLGNVRQRIGLCPTKAASQRTQLTGVKFGILFISWPLLKTQNHSVSISHFCSIFLLNILKFMNHSI